MENSGKSSTSNSKRLNPWMLHLQKLALELKCPLCLSLFDRPVLLPCNHLFCNSCLTDCLAAGSECAVCKTKCAQTDIRHVPFVENIVAIYRSLDAAFCPSLFQQRPSDDVRVLEPCQAFLNSTSSNKKAYRVPQSLPNSNGIGISKNHKSKIAIQCPQMEIGGNEDSGAVEMDVNQVTQSAPDSPFCNTKGSDNDCSGQDSEHLFPSERVENSSLKRASTENGDVKERVVQFRSESSASETEGLMTSLKRPKSLTQRNIVHHDKIVETKSRKDNGAVLTINAPNDLQLSMGTCSFCHSSTTSESTGPMLHYRNENLVTGDTVMQPDVIHVHRLCIDWAPQIYFVGEVIKNLKAELARGAKLKCSECGLKGAALGCYVKSCRKTYHVPCALGISTCRWDDEDFLLLCPVHSHVRFPSEKSRPKKQKTQEHPPTSDLTSQHSNPLGVSQDDGKKMVFCGSALSNEEKVLLINYASKVGAIVTKYWTSNVTHVIAATDENGACSRTLKVLMAILNGRWILKFDWIKACMEEINPVDEEPYEINLDNHGRHGGPKAGRLTAVANEPKLFSGLKFYFSGDYVSSYKEDLEGLVEVGGGTVLRSKDALEARRHESEVASSKLLIVYNLDPPHGFMLGEEVSILWKRLNEAEDLAANTGSQVIGHTWILESIAACKLQHFVN